MARASRFRTRRPEEEQAAREAARTEEPVRLMIRVALGREGALGPGKVKLMEKIDEVGSISAASRAMGMSYRRAWLLINGVNQAFRHDAVATQHGGRKGGGAGLTPFGRELISRYRAIEARARQSVEAEIDNLRREYVDWRPEQDDDNDGDDA